MQKDISNKIRLLLNELAILNQPDVYEGKYFYSPSALLQIKNLSAELYLLSSNLLESGYETAQAEQKTIKETIHAEPVEIKEESKSEPVTVNEVVTESSPEITVAKAPEIKAVDPEPPRQEAPKIEEPVKKVAEVVSENKDIFSGKISFTRKFEYINNLFGGDGQAYAAFLSEISAASDKETALQIFETAFESRSWKKRAETSDDLKSLIKKVK